LTAQIIATFLSVYGLLMAPIGWADAGIVWGYSIVMFFFQDFVKLGARRILSEEESGYFGKHSRNE
jgi:H+-transporting ATPase